MSTFNPGGGTLKSTNLSAATEECLGLIEVEEGVQGTANKLTSLSNNHQSNNRSLSFSGNLDYVESGSGEGSTISIVDYLPGFTFDPGTDGDLTATSLPGALYQLLQLAIEKQAAAGVTVISSLSLNGVSKQINYQGSFPATLEIDANGRLAPTVIDVL